MQLSCWYMESRMHCYRNGDIKATLVPVWRGQYFELCGCRFDVQCIDGLSDFSLWSLRSQLCSRLEIARNFQQFQITSQMKGKTLWGYACSGFHRIVLQLLSFWSMLLWKMLCLWRNKYLVQPPQIILQWQMLQNLWYCSLIFWLPDPTKIFKCNFLSSFVREVVFASYVLVLIEKVFIYAAKGPQNLLSELWSCRSLVDWWQMWFL